MNNITIFNKKLFVGILIMSVLILCFVGIFSLSEKRNENKFEVKALDEHSFDSKSALDSIDYNFDLILPKDKEVIVSQNSIDTQVTTASVNSVASLRLEPNTLVIPRLNVNTKVIMDIDGEAAIHEGAWFYPGSYEENGEKILLGHRRFWGPDDPRSFWNLDQLIKGDKIHYSDNAGNTFTYKVIGTSITNGADHSILNASRENLLKVISCSTADGSAGSSEMRIVVIAELV